jgi:hypothetical protein
MGKASPREGTVVALVSYLPFGTVKALGHPCMGEFGKTVRYVLTSRL